MNAYSRANRRIYAGLVRSPVGPPTGTASTICSSATTTARRPGWPGCASRPSSRTRATYSNTSSASKPGRRSTCLPASAVGAPEPPAQDRLAKAAR